MKLVLYPTWCDKTIHQESGAKQKILWPLENSVCSYALVLTNKKTSKFTKTQIPDFKKFYNSFVVVFFLLKNVGV